MGEISFRETSGLEVVCGTFFFDIKGPFALWWAPPPRNRPAGTCRCAGAVDSSRSRVAVAKLCPLSVR